MTKKDHILIANAINSFDFPYTDKVWKKFLRASLTSHISVFLKRDNALFDADKFREVALKERRDDYTGYEVAAQPLKEKK